MTQKTRVMVLAGSLLLAVSQAGLAQEELLGRYFLNVNVGVQAPGRNLQEIGGVPLYDENLTYTGTRKVGSGLLADVAAGVDLSESFALGIAYSRFSKSSDVTLDARVPHPLFVGRPRSAAAGLGGLGRTEHGVHFMALWRMLLMEGVDLKVGGGPSFFHVSEEGPSGATATESGPPYETVAVAFSTGSRSKNGVGYNLVADVTYMINERLGAGVLLRYTGGKVEVPMPGDQTRDGNGVGGLNLGGGLRLRF